MFRPKCLVFVVTGLHVVKCDSRIVKSWGLALAGSSRLLVGRPLRLDSQLPPMIRVGQKQVARAGSGRFVPCQVKKACEMLLSS